VVAYCEVFGKSPVVGRARAQAALAYTASVPSRTPRGSGTHARAWSLQRTGASRPVGASAIGVLSGSFSGKSC
jgi:hypothetical protein